MNCMRILEYLLYLSVFILMFKLSESATVNRTDEEDNAVTTEELTASITQNLKKFGTREAKKLGLENCEDGLSWMCLKMEIIRFIERMTEKDEVKLLPGLEIVKDNDAAISKPAEMFAEIARSFPNDPSSRLNSYIVSKLTNYLQSHVLQLKLMDNNTISEARSLVESGRGKAGKKGGGMEALIAAGLVMKGTLMALGLGALAMLAGKALTTALMALMLSAVVGLKALSSGKETKYEIVAKPIYTTSHHHDDHGHGHSAYAGYSRSLQLEKPSG